MKNNKNSLAWYFIIVLLVVGLLIYITFKSENVKNDQLSENTNMENTQNVEGVKVTILKEGSGEMAKPGDIVSMNYTGMLTDGTVFDSNIDPKFQHVEPFIFTLGAGQVIPGWDVGVAGMKIGEKRNLVIEPNYAYGARGAGEVIPPNATLSFDVELVDIKK